MRRGAWILPALCLASALAAVAPTSGPVRASVESRSKRVVTALPNGRLERPRLDAGSIRYGARGARWQFVDSAGLVRAGHTTLRDVPTPTSGSQAAFLQNTGAMQLVVSVGPGDVLRFNGTQRIWNRTGQLRLSVSVDGAFVGSVVPPDRSWQRFDVPLAVTSRKTAVIEIRGVYAGEGQDRMAFVDDVQLLRRPSAIADAGLAEETRRLIVEPDSIPLAGGVVGSVAPGDSHPTINTPVQAFAQIGDTVFVGGKFTRVEKGPGGTHVAQRFLAAFDRSTGEWISSFRPRLDGMVWDLAATPDGKLIVGGQFTSVNGKGQTSALAALDPVTGEVVPGWRANLQLTGSTDRAEARTLDVDGDWIYVGGNFTRVGPLDSQKMAGRLVRVSIADGHADGAFLPDIQQGTVNGVDATPTEVWVVGDFRAVGYKGKSYSRLAVAKLAVADARPMSIVGYVPTIGESAKQYVYSVTAVGGHVWIAGSQHMTQVYRRSDFSLIRGWINFPIGDGQDVVELDGIVYVGSHAGEISNVYGGVQTWDSVSGAISKDANRWVGAFDDKNLRFVPGWFPNLSSASSEGGWDLFVDSEKCLWAGGDFDGGSRVDGRHSYAAGFVKFCSNDVTAPVTPAGVTARKVTAGGVRVSWSAVADGGGQVRYEVFRNDRLIGKTTKKRTIRDKSGSVGDRYFVRSVDASGNRSSTTGPVLAVGP